MWRKRESEKRRDEEREDRRGVRGATVGKKEDGEDEGAEGKCVNDAALPRNASNGRQSVPQVSITADVMVCQRESRAWRLILMRAANCLGNTLRIHNIHLCTACIQKA